MTGWLLQSVIPASLASLGESEVMRCDLDGSAGRSIFVPSQARWRLWVHAIFHAQVLEATKKPASTRSRCEALEASERCRRHAVGVQAAELMAVQAWRFRTA